MILIKGSRKNCRSMFLTMENKVGMNFVRNDEKSVFLANFHHLLDVFRCPDDTQRIMRIAEKEHLSVFCLFFKILKINGPPCFSTGHLRFRYSSSRMFRNFIELGINRRLEQNTVSFFCKKLDQGSHCGNNSDGPTHKTGIRIPLIAFFFPFPNSFKITCGTGCIAPNSFFSLLSACVNDGLSRTKIHIRYPKGDYIHSSKDLFPLIILGRTILTPIDDFIKVVFHKNVSLFLYCHNFNLYPRAFGKSSNLKRCPSRERFRKISPIHSVHGTKISYIR